MEIEKVAPSIRKLIGIINYEFELDLLEKTRKRPHTEARMILSKILTDRYKYGRSRIADLLDMNHATVVYYLQQIPFLLKHEKPLSDKYETIVNKYQDIDDPIWDLTEAELKTLAFTLRNENKNLNLELNHQKNKIEIFEKHKELIEYLEENNVKNATQLLIKYIERCIL